MPQKWMWIIAGPNGAGKSSFANEFIDNLRIPNLLKLNADEKTLELRRALPEAPQRELNLQAAQIIDDRVRECIAANQSFLVETVLSTGKYRDDVEAAKAAGFKFGLIYVSVWPPSVSPDRVKIRVAKGGHDVERAKAIDRYHKSHAQLSWFAPLADALFVLDNTALDTEAVLIAKRASGKALQHVTPSYNPAVDTALADLLQQQRKNRRRKPKPKPDSEP